MRNVIGPTALGLLILATGCVESGYPTTYGYQPYAAPAYYGRPTYYSAPPVYVARPAPPRAAWGWRDDDRDGIPNRYDRGRNNDGVPDRFQRRGWNG